MTQKVASLFLKFWQLTIPFLLLGHLFTVIESVVFHVMSHLASLTGQPSGARPLVHSLAVVPRAVDRKVTERNG